MIFLLIILCVAPAVTPFEKLVLKSSVQSLSGQVRLFQEWEKKQHTHYNNNEKRARFRVFKKHLQKIVAINDAQDKFKCDINFMAGLTDDEQQRYGMNETAFLTDVQNKPTEIIKKTDKNLLRMKSLSSTSSSKSWSREGKVTPVKSQGECGSCWAFSAVAVIESRYAIKTGTLKTFSDQEALDCAYEVVKVRDGCTGGLAQRVWGYIRDNNHLSLEKDYRYRGEDGPCLMKSKPNALDGFTVTSIGWYKSDLDSLAEVIGKGGPVDTVIKLRDEVYYYEKGLLRVPNCDGNGIKHAVAVTGYTPSYFEVKNSWGVDWGEKGYFRWERIKENVCFFFDNGYTRPKFRKGKHKKTGQDRI